MSDPMWMRAQKARKLLKNMAKKKNIDMKSITGPYHFKYLVDIRKEFIHKAYDLGLGMVLIGRILNRNHSTIAYHTDPELRRRKRLRYRNSLPQYLARQEDGKFRSRSLSQ